MRSAGTKRLRPGESDSMEEWLTEETYWYDTMKEAIEAMQVMMAERACDMAFDADPVGDKVKLVVKCGKTRG